jgi:hypothetical protein
LAVRQTAAPMHGLNFVGNHIVSERVVLVHLSCSDVFSEISAIGARALAECLRQTAAPIAELDASYNPIGDDASFHFESRRL